MIFFIPQALFYAFDSFTNVIHMCFLSPFLFEYPDVKFISDISLCLVLDPCAQMCPSPLSGPALYYRTVKCGS